MSFEQQLRAAMDDLASDITTTDGLAATALRRARRRQYAARTALVGTAAAVTVPVGISVLDTSGADHQAVPAPAGTSSEGSAPAPPTASGAESEIVPAPSYRELNADELASAFGTCRDIPGGNSGYDGWAAAFGITIETDAKPGVPTTWVGAQRGDDFRADCVLDSSGHLAGGGGVYGAKSTPRLLYAQVDGQEGAGVGRYVEPVAQVTVQYEDEPEQAAVLQNGFWFLPYDENRLFRSELDEDLSVDERQEQEPFPPDSVDNGLIGVPQGYTFRGYDANGDLVYDSSTDGPSIEDCYADPTGTEFVGSSAGHDDPSECVRTHQWRQLP